MSSKSETGMFANLSLRDRSSSLVQLATDQIETLIRERPLVEGDQLPNERELCRQFGVSRTVVREAISATQNELFVILLDSLRGISLTIRRLGYSTPGNPQRALRYQRAILEQVKAGNVKGARDAMLSHLIEAEETMYLALALKAEGQSASATSAGQPGVGVAALRRGLH